MIKMSIAASAGIRVPTTRPGIIAMIQMIGIIEVTTRIIERIRRSRGIRVMKGIPGISVMITRPGNIAMIQRLGIRRSRNIAIISRLGISEITASPARIIKRSRRPGGVPKLPRLPSKQVPT